MQLSLSKTMTNEEIAQVFEFVGQILGMDPRNKYRARAYDEGSVIIHQLSYELHDAFIKLQTENPETAQKEFYKQLDALPGIGEAMANKLVELFTTGNIEAFQKYVKDTPAGIYPLAQLYGIGTKKASKLAKHFDLTNAETAIATLLAHAKAGEIRDLEGFGEKSEQDLIENLQQKHTKGRIPYQDALIYAEKIKEALEKSPIMTRVSFLGSLRRKSETVGDIDMGMSVDDVEEIKKYIAELSIVRKVLVAGNNIIRIILQNTWQVDIKLSSEAEWGSFIQHFTGSKEHNIRLREIALKKGLSLSEHGIKIRETDRMKTFEDEEKFYNYLGFNLIPPQERKGGEEFEKYRKE